VPRSPQDLSLAPPRSAAWRALAAAGAVAVTLVALTLATGPGAAAQVPAGAAPPAEAPQPVEAQPPAETSPPAEAAPPADTSPAAAPPATAPPAPAPASPPPADDAALVTPGKRIAGDGVGSRLIDVATPFTIGRRRFEVLFTHRFLQPVNQGANAHNLWGLDSGADVGIGLAYGVLRHLDVSVYRSQFQEDYELAGKLQLLDQTESPRAPLSAAVRAGADLLGRPGIVDPHRPFVQVLLGRALASGLNLFLSPSWVRATPLLHNAWNVPVGLTVPLPGKWLLDGEVIAPNHSLHHMTDASRLAWHAAFAKQIGWHLFQIVIGNSRATTVDQILGGDFAGGFTTHDVRLGFNLIRYFSP